MLLPCASGRYPAHAPLNPGLLFASENRSGRKTSGSFHKCGDLNMQTHSAQINQSCSIPQECYPNRQLAHLSQAFSREGKDVDGTAVHLWRFQTEMNMSAPLPMGYPAGSPLRGAGSTSSASDLLIRIGGCGYMRRDSARAALTYGSFLRSSRSACASACQRRLAPKALQKYSDLKGVRVLVRGGCLKEPA